MAPLLTEWSGSKLCFLWPALGSAAGWCPVEAQEELPWGGGRPPVAAVLVLSLPSGGRVGPLSALWLPCWSSLRLVCRHCAWMVQGYGSSPAQPCLGPSGRWAEPGQRAHCGARVTADAVLGVGHGFHALGPCTSDHLGESMNPQLLSEECLIFTPSCG